MSGKEISIKFSPYGERAILNGLKVCTTRLERKGEIGDYFKMKIEYDYNILIFNVYLIEIKELPLWFVANYLYRLEGFESTEAFIKHWDELSGEYPRYKYANNDAFPVHFLSVSVEGGIK